MASYTTNLNLLKKNPLTEGSDAFNIDTMLNDNWDKIDAAVGALEDDMPAPSSTTPAMDGTAAEGSEEAYARGDHVHPTDTSRAPTSHASAATTYGVGNGSNYGHVKLSDSTTSTSAASAGIAASPKAVKAVNDRLTYGTTDLTAGTSNLTTGVLYFVYE